MRTNGKVEPSIGRLLKAANNQMLRELDQFASTFQLTGQQMSILDFIGRLLEEGKTVSGTAIEHEFNIRRSTTTEILQRMEKRELIYRQTLPSDARQKEIRLTSAGENYLPEIRTFIQQHDQKFLAEFSSAEIETIKKFFGQFIDDEH